MQTCFRAVAVIAMWLVGCAGDTPSNRQASTVRATAGAGEAGGTAVGAGGTMFGNAASPTGTDRAGTSG